MFIVIIEFIRYFIIIFLKQGTSSIWS